MPKKSEGPPLPDRKKRKRDDWPTLKKQAEEEPLYYALGAVQRGREMGAPEGEVRELAVREWQRWKDVVAQKPQDAPHAIRAAKILGVNDEELNQFAKGAFDREMASGNIALAYGIMKVAELGSAEERSALGARVYEQHTQNRNPGGAVLIANELWGRESDQFARAIALHEEMLQRGERHPWLLPDDLPTGR